MASWESWVKNLHYGGYTVDQGTVVEVDNAACQQFITVFGSCFGNNSAAPYIIPVPPVDFTIVDPYYASSFAMYGETGSTSNMFYRLSDSDALVTIVLPPPKAAYLGYQSYLFSRVTSGYTGSSSGKTVSPDPGRYEIFASLGNDLNSVMLQRSIGSFWGGEPVVYVTASNSSIANSIKANAAALGLDSTRIFIEPLGDNVLTGSSLAADDLITLFRYALPEDSTASTQWLSTLRSNIRVYRVHTRAAVSRYPTPIYSSKTGTDETATYAAPLNELSSLLSTWLTGHQGAGVTTTIKMQPSEQLDETGQPVGLVGAQCIVQGTSCLGDNQDTDSYRSGVIGTLTGNNMAIVAGVNHTLTDNASYISLAVYNAFTLTATAGASQTNPLAVGFNSGVMTGSAEAVLRSLGLYDFASSTLKAALPNLYVEFVARTCTWVPTYCIELGNPASLPLTAPIIITQRAYIRPGSTTGANPNIMQTPRVIYQPTQLSLTATRDFNGDGFSDILWRDTGGDVAMWFMNGATVSSFAGLGNITPSWTIVGQRDFNGDGKSDILWRNANGEVAIWLMNGSQVLSFADLGNITPSWTIVGTGDFNGDGFGDILWRDTSGNVAIWLMNGTQVTSSAVIGNVPLNWTIVGTGDFNGDGKWDILWRDTSGNVAIWLMNGFQVSSSAIVANAPTYWTIVGTGDFSGTGRSDILWRDTGGDVAIWFMNGTTISSAAGLGNVPTYWNVVTTGDYYGAGTSDILWTDTGGDLGIWKMNGATIVSTAGLGNIPTVWTPQSANAD